MADAGSQGDTRPVPDPTALTTEQSERLEKSLRVEIAALGRLIEQRFTLEESRRVELKRDEQAQIDRRFQAVEQQLEAAEQRRGEEKEDRKEQIAHALTASNQRVEGGEQRMREHIAAEIRNVQAALNAARNEFLQTQESSERAISKAEAANERRFEAVNEFREQLSVQTQTFMPREVADAQFNEIRRALADLTAKVSKVVE